MLLPHTDNEVKAFVADESPDVVLLNHDRRKERENLFVEEIAHERLVERQRAAVLVQMDVLPLQFRQNRLAEDALELALLAVHFARDLGQRRLRLFRTLLRVVLLQNHAPVFRHADFVKLLHVRRVDGKELNALVDRQRCILRLHQHAIVERKPTHIALKVSIFIFHDTVRF